MGGKERRRLAIRRSNFGSPDDSNSVEAVGVGSSISIGVEVEVEGASSSTRMGEDEGPASASSKVEEGTRSETFMFDAALNTASRCFFDSS